MRRWAVAALAVLCMGAAPAWSACQPPGASGFPAGSTRLDTQTKDSVSLTGGCIDGVPIGQNTPAAGDFTNLTVNGAPVYSDAVVDIRKYGNSTTCNGAADDTAAFLAANAALEAGSLGAAGPLGGRGGKIGIPGGSYICHISAGFTGGIGVGISGLEPIAPTYYYSKTGPQIVCSDLDAACVTIGAASAGTSAGISDVIVSYSGTPVAGAQAVVVRGYNSVIQNVAVDNAYDAFVFKSGLSSTVSNIFTGRIVNRHIIQDGSPEVRIKGARFGTNSGDPATSKAFVGITGNNPNGLFCDQCQFNLGSQSPDHLVEFYSVTNQVDGIYQITNSVVDMSIGGCDSLIKTDASAFVYRLQITNSFINAPTCILLDQATQARAPLDMHITSNAMLATGGISVTTDATGGTSFDISGNNIASGSVTFNTAGINGRGIFSNNKLSNNLTLTSAGGAWKTLFVVNNHVGGTVTDTATGTKTVQTAPLTTTGTGAATFALPSATATYTFPAASSALMGMTPATCDGFKAGDGAISTGTPNFSSATASFVAGDVGKKISINKAGATQYFGFATIAAGGTGYARGDLIVLSGGTGTASTVVVRTVSAGVITAIAGEAGSLGAYTAVPSNAVAQATTTGVGTGATFTVTWLRDNLVTTIISRQSATQVTLAANASATASSALWGYGTDYATEINTAIATGTTTTLPKGICGIGTTVSVGDSQRLMGGGTGGYSTAPSSLMWLGAVDGTVFAIDNGGLVNGGRAGPFNVRGMGAAKYGVRVRGLAHGAIDVQSENAKDFGISLEEDATTTNDTFFNDFKLVSVQVHGASRNAVGISFPKGTPSGGGHNPNGNNFYNTAVYHQDGIGIDLRQGYLNTFLMTQLYSLNFNGWAVRFGGDNDDPLLTARGNIFYDLITNNASLYAEGGTAPGAGSQQNRIFPLDVAAVSPPVVMDEGTTLYCETTAGNTNHCTPHGYDVRTCGSPTGTATTANYVAMGCGGTITVSRSSRIYVTISGGLKNATAGGGALISLYWGTGTAPANGDNIEAAGTTRIACGSVPALINTPSTTFMTPFTAVCQTSGLTKGIANWYDIGVKAVTAGTASIANSFATAHELP